MAIIFLADTQDKAEIGEAAIQALAETYSAFVPFREAHVEFSCVDRDTIRTVNAEHRHIDEPTDVLSFPLYEPEDITPALGQTEPVLLGSIMICPEITLYYRESLLQVLHHGMLHVLGFDHETDQDAWDRQEQVVLEALANRGYKVQPLGHAEI